MESIPLISTHLYLYKYIFTEECNQKKCIKKIVWRLKKSTTEMLGNTRLNYSPSLHLHCSFYIWQSHQFFFPLPRSGHGEDIALHEQWTCVLLTPHTFLPADLLKLTGFPWCSSTRIQALHKWWIYLHNTSLRREGVIICSPDLGMGGGGRNEALDLQFRLT